MRPPRPKAMFTNDSNQSKDKNTFRNKVESSNQNVICTASVKVGRRSMNHLIQDTKYHVPIFQRRYCWTSVQWDTILLDASRGNNHSLGRLTCTNNFNSSERSCILDGQQRFTTITILLASIRDALMNRHGYNLNDPAISSINKLLFPDTNEMNEYIHNKEFHFFEGMELSFARLIPTFCDRMSYYLAILPFTNDNQTVLSMIQENKISWYRPLQAKRYFDNKLNKYTKADQMLKMLNSILHEFNMLYFPISVDKGYTDGTEDLMIIYERLAIRDATWCKPHRQQEYVSMDGSDMIRNLLLGSFSSEDNAILFYKDYWLPLEQRFNGSNGMNGMLRSFLEEQLGKKDTKNLTSKDTVIGGKLYADFQFWLSSYISEKNATMSLNSEDLTRNVGKMINEFADLGK